MHLYYYQCKPHNLFHAHHIIIPQEDISFLPTKTRNKHHPPLYTGKFLSIPNHARGMGSTGAMMKTMKHSFVASILNLVQNLLFINDDDIEVIALGHVKDNMAV